MRKRGYPLILSLAGVMLFTGIQAVAFDWQRSAESGVIYCNAPESGSVPRGRSYAVTFYTEGSRRAELQYRCSITRNPARPYKQEVASTMRCNYINKIPGTEYLIDGKGSSESLFQSSEPSAICAHAYFDLGITAAKK